MRKTVSFFEDAGRNCLNGGGGCFVGLADGSVNWFGDDLDYQLLRQLSAPADGEAPRSSGNDRRGWAGLKPFPLQRIESKTPPVERPGGFSLWHSLLADVATPSTDVGNLATGSAADGAPPIPHPVPSQPELPHHPHATPDGRRPHRGASPPSRETD